MQKKERIQSPKSSYYKKDYSYLCTQLNLYLTMKRILLLFIWTFCLYLPIHTVAQDYQSALMPMPNSVTSVKGKPFKITPNKLSVYTNSSELRFETDVLQQIMKERMNEDIAVANNQGAAIHLLIEPTLTGNEHYLLSIDKNKIVIKGRTPGAIYYGLMTLDQLMLGDVCATANKEIHPVLIDDEPRFAFRALMLDPARNFLPVKDVKFYIDQISKYKFNTLQLHLTDDQGWRMEIETHPTIASKQHYTKTELKDIIEYANERNIEIIPELDIPGHTVAILAALPELGCSHTDTMPKIVGKTTDMMLCANNEKVYQVYQDIIKEVAELFPSKYIHLGGDEAVVEKNWTKCERCKKLAHQLGYTKAYQLMIPFFHRMLGFVEENHKKPILWCELNSIYYPATDYLFPYPKNVTLVSWRGGLTPTSLDLAYKHGNRIIAAPGEYAYLDYPQLKGDLPEFNNWGMPVTTLQDCYKFDPGYNLPAEEQQNIWGMMGTLWGEAMPNINRVTYMTFPRAFALSEAGWTQMKSRNWNSFKQRLYPNLLDLIKDGVSVRAPFEISDKRK